MQPKPSRKVKEFVPILSPPFLGVGQCLQHKLEAQMVSDQLIFLVIVLLTVASGAGAIAISMFGNTRRNAGQRAVAERLAQIAATGMTAIVALLSLRP